MTDARAYTRIDFCRAYGIGKTTFYEEVKSGRLPVRKIGRRTLVLADDAERWAQSLPSVGRIVGKTVAMDHGTRKNNGLGE
jgi:hypothetical protein